MTRRLFRGWRVAAFVAMLPGIHGCTPSTVTVSWTEDVQLGSGQIVVVERKETSHTAGQWGQGTEYYTTSASLRARSGPTWLTSEWSAPVQPLVFERDETTKEFVIVGYPGECQFYDRLGAPASFYVEYRFRQGAWQLVPLSESSIGHAANLLLTVNSTRESGHISLEEKRRRDGVSGASWRARSINLNGSNPCRGGPLKK
jgi:hypothetical protein